MTAMWLVAVRRVWARLFVAPRGLRPGPVPDSVRSVFALLAALAGGGAALAAVLLPWFAAVSS